MLKLTEHVGITISLLYKQKSRRNLRNSQFTSTFRSGMSLWRHNYVTPWPIVLILVCMDRKGLYLPIDTKTNFIGGSVWKI